jgi:sulfide:quinone oxidoreductase
MSHESARIVILGAGFAALTAARELRQRAPAANISLVSPSAEFVYLPSLIWIPPGIRKGSDLIIPLDRFLKKYRIVHVIGSVTGLKNGGRTVLTDCGEI